MSLISGGDEPDQLQPILALARPFLRGELESVDENLPRLVAVLRSVGAGECWHKHGSFLDHLLDIYRILKLWGAPEAVCLCGLFHSAYSNSYVNLAIFDPSTGRDVVRGHVGEAAENLIHLFCIVPRQSMIHDDILFKYPDDAELRRHVSESEVSVRKAKEKREFDAGEEWRAKLNSILPKEGVKVKHIRTGEEVSVSRRIVAVFLQMTMADFSDQLFGFQDALFENSDGRLEFAGNSFGALWPGDGKPGLWVNSISRMGAVYALIAREEEIIRVSGGGGDAAEVEVELVVPPVLERCTKVVDAKEQVEARELYWEAVTGKGSGSGADLAAAEDLLVRSVEKNGVVGEPRVVLAQVYLSKGRFEEAEEAAASGLRLILEWGSAWDKRMSWEGWVAWARVLLMKAQEKSWPNTSWGILNLGLVRVLGISTHELQHRFDIELPESVKQLFTYARNFVEFVSYQTIDAISTHPDFLSDNTFRRLTYDMMLAWEAPCVEFHLKEKIKTSSSPSENHEDEDEDPPSLFYSSSTNMAVQVDDAKTVGREAFTRIAPACVAIADVITVHNLFDALTSSSGQQLHFLIYDKYLHTLDKNIKATKLISKPSATNVELEDGEIILDADGTIPTQPVLQHIGISAWPGRLVLTNYAIYFESLGVGVYEKATRYDLATDMKQVIKPDLTGPLGARVFDKAVMYKSISSPDPVYFEFPEFKANSRRDYWLDICLEILHAHRFLRKKVLTKVQELDILARASLGIIRYRAVREAFSFFASSHYKSLLVFNLAESLPKGDKILGTLTRLSSSTTLPCTVTPSSNRRDSDELSKSPTAAQRSSSSSPTALLALNRLGLVTFKSKTATSIERLKATVGDLIVGEINPLEVVVKQSMLAIGKAEAAQATVDKVKVEGIDTNVAVMKDLLIPITKIVNRIQVLTSWRDPFRSMMFLVMGSFAILRGWTRYMVSSILVCGALFIFWRRHFSKKKALEPFRVTAPANKNAVEQLLTIQEAIATVETLVQDGNVVLLKIRALLFSILPQATERLALLLFLLAIAMVVVPLRHLMLLVFLETFTREMPYRKESSDRWVRRLREWWVRIPAAPVQVVRVDEKKRK